MDCAQGAEDRERPARSDTVESPTTSAAPATGPPLARLPDGTPGAIRPVRLARLAPLARASCAQRRAARRGRGRRRSAGQGGERSAPSFGIVAIVRQSMRFSALASAKRKRPRPAAATTSNSRDEGGGGRGGEGVSGEYPASSTSTDSGREAGVQPFNPSLTATACWRNIASPP